MKISGVYEIRIVNSDGRARYYIGQSSNMRVRWQTHVWRLKRGDHSNRILQNHFDKYGVESISFKVVSECSATTADLDRVEQETLIDYIERFGDDGVINVNRTWVKSRLGVKSTAETRQRQSVALKGRKLSAEQMAEMSRSRLGKPLSPEAIAKRTAKQKGRVDSPEVRERRAAAIRGHKHLPEFGRKVSASKKGKCSEKMLAHIERLATLNAGKKRSAEVVERIAAAKRGVPKSAEEIARRQATRAANRAA